MKAIKFLTLVLLATAARADTFNVSFTALTSFDSSGLPADEILDLTGQFITGSDDTVLDFFVDVLPRLPFPHNHQWEFWPPNLGGSRGGVATYDRQHNTLLASFTSFDSQSLSIRPDGTWYTDFGGALFETGVYTITSASASTPEPAGWLLLGGVLAGLAIRRRIAYRDRDG